MVVKDSVMVIGMWIYHYKQLIICFHDGNGNVWQDLGLDSKSSAAKILSLQTSLLKKKKTMLGFSIMLTRNNVLFILCLCHTCVYRLKECAQSAKSQKEQPTLCWFTKTVFSEHLRNFYCLSELCLCPLLWASFKFMPLECDFRQIANCIWPLNFFNSREPVLEQNVLNNGSLAFQSRLHPTPLSPTITLMGKIYPSFSALE